MASLRVRMFQSNILWVQLNQPIIFTSAGSKGNLLRMLFWDSPIDSYSEFWHVCWLLMGIEFSETQKIGYVRGALPVL